MDQNALTSAEIFIKQDKTSYKMPKSPEKIFHIYRIGTVFAAVAADSAQAALCFGGICRSPTEAPKS